MFILSINNMNTFVKVYGLMTLGVFLRVTYDRAREDISAFNYEVYKLTPLNKKFKKFSIVMCQYVVTDSVSAIALPPLVSGMVLMTVVNWLNAHVHE